MNNQFGFLSLMNKDWYSGISAGICTQLTDVEVECNCLITYDRKIIKVDTARIGYFFREMVNKY